MTQTCGKAFEEQKYENTKNVEIIEMIEVERFQSFHLESAKGKKPNSSDLV